MSVTEVISCDSHVQVFHDDVKRRLASRFHDEYDGAVAEFERSMTSTSTAPSGTMNLNSLVSTGVHPAAGRPGHHDAAQRLQDMDVDGVQAEIMYSEVSAFRYLYLLPHGTAEATRAFNDTLHDFAEADRARLVVSYQIPIHDVDVAVAEVERVIALGARSLQLPVYPADLGLPDYYDERYGRLFSVIEESGLPICCHIGLKASAMELGRRDPTPSKSIMAPTVPLGTAEAFGMWIIAGVLERFPRLKLVFVEAGLGWVPFWLEKVDDMVTRRGLRFPGLTELPSVYFRRQIFLSFVDEPIALNKLRYELGVENIMWSTDYPHSMSSWPNSRQIIAEQFADIPPAEVDLIVRENARRVWNLGSSA